MNNAMKHLEDACETIDASVFSGDLLYDEERMEALQHYMDRWDRAMVKHESATLKEEFEAKVNGFELHAENKTLFGHLIAQHVFEKLDRIDDSQRLEFLKENLAVVESCEHGFSVFKTDSEGFRVVNMSACYTKNWRSAIDAAIMNAVKES